MNTKSLSFRLSAWVIVSFLVSTLLSFGGFYLVTKKLLYSHTDSSLTAHGNKVTQVVTAQEVGMHDAIAKEAFIREFSEIPGMLVVIADSQGVVVPSSLADRSNPIYYELFSKSKEQQQPFFANRTVGEITMRLFVSPIIKNDVLVGSVIVAHPTDVISKALNSLVFAEIVVFLVLIIPVTLGGVILVRRGLLPVSILARRMAQIEPSDLSARVTNPRTSDAMEDLAEAFNNLLERLKASFERERQFIGDVAHEVKTPLSIVSGTAEVALSRSRTREDYKKALAEVFAETTKMSNTLRNVMDLAWSQSESSGSGWESFSLSEMMEELLEVAAKLGQLKHIEVRGKIQKSVSFKGKREKLYRAILNLIDNAIKFTPLRGQVSLTLQQVSDSIKIEIYDTGVGIASKDLPHIFDRFYRGSISEKSVGGGLGLAIASSIIAEHRGKIEVESTVNKGSKFVVFFTKS